MPNGFVPNGAFEGYVAAKLEAITEKFGALPCNESFKRLNKTETDIANIKGKATAWGAVVGAITGFLAALAVKLIGD